MLRRSLIAVALTLSLAMAAGGCGADDPEPTPTKKPTVSPTLTAPAWESEYTDAELADYKAALKLWNDYVRESDPVWAEGKYTSEAERIFKFYWFQHQIPAERLRSYERAQLTVRGPQTVLWSRPDTLKPGLVLLRQCVDATQATVTIKGKEQTPPKSPFLRIINVSKTTDGSWKILRVKDPGTRWLKPCEG